MSFFVGNVILIHTESVPKKKFWFVKKISYLAISKLILINNKGMIGAIIGDIVGSRFEFDNTENPKFELFTSECDFTDDTICTIAVADAIMKGTSYKESFLSWCRRYPNPMGAYGGSFERWLFSTNNEPYGSYGNGSAMRVSPVAWLFDTLEEVKCEAEATALPTHNHPEGVKGAVSLAHAIFHFRKGGDKSGFIELAKSYYPDFLERDYKVGYFDVTCQGTVPLCMNVIAKSESFEETIRNVILYGGDTDTNGAIACSMAEALWGIPEQISKKALSYLPQEMLDVVAEYRKRITI